MSDQTLGSNLGRVEIFEMGPRDGLQNEKAEISVEQKVALVECSVLVSKVGYPQ